MDYPEYSLQNPKHKKILFLTDIHYCSQTWHGVENNERMNLLCTALKKEYERNPYDMILCLGDYSLDFWCCGGSYLNSPKTCNTENFVKKVFPDFPAPAYMLPGNHEQYGDELWKNITGFPRRFSIIYDGCVFVMCDTFSGNLNPKENSDGVYAGINSDFLRNIISRHNDKKIFLCMHDLQPDKENEDIRKMIKENDNIICAFTGHTHSSNTLILSSQWRNLPVFYCGDFSYCANYTDDSKPHWGYRLLNLENNLSTEYIQACI